MVPGPDGLHGIVEEHGLQLARAVPLVPDQPLQSLEAGLLGVDVHQPLDVGHPTRSNRIHREVRRASGQVGRLSGIESDLLEGPVNGG